MCVGAARLIANRPYEALSSAEDGVGDRGCALTDIRNPGERSTRQVDATPGDVRATVIDPDDGRTAITDVGDADAGAQRQSLVCLLYTSPSPRD